MSTTQTESPSPSQKADANGEDRETVSAAAAAREDDPAKLARHWLLEVTAGTLCTTAAKPEVEGFPFGSVVPYALTADGRPVVYLARIAAHTANLRRDQRGTLFIRQPGIEGDPQKGWRLGMMGTFERLAPNGADVEDKERDHVCFVDDEELEDVRARYVERVPWARDYAKTHNFSYWRMKQVTKARYIAGFGKICWLEGDEVLREPAGDGVGDAAAGAVAHMNEDHVENMREMVHGLYGMEPETARMVHLDRTGFMLRTEGPSHLLHFSFGKEINDRTLRKEVVGVLQRARALRDGAS